MRNKYRIEIKECCASCQYKEVLKNGSRVCTKMELLVRSTNKCRLWQMSEGLKKAGKGY